jgi:hypothetical protein
MNTMAMSIKMEPVNVEVAWSTGLSSIRIGTVQDGKKRIADGFLSRTIINLFTGLPTQTERKLNWSID